MDAVAQFRNDKDELFAKGAESPLDAGQKEAFSGLKYFPPNTQLVFRNLKLETTGGEEIVQIPTSAGDSEPYKVLGQIQFQIENTPCKLTVYESSRGGNIFLPFKDKTNRNDTYHDGRYVEIEIENGIVTELDFNYAYNPYCAYNDRWRCPRTPEENTLTVAIAAGERRFH